VHNVLVNFYFLTERTFEFGSPWLWIGRCFDLLLILVLCHQIARRRNWARIVYAIMTFIGFAQLCYRFVCARRLFSGDELLELLPRFLIAQVLPVALSLAAIHLLFFSSGGWFREREIG